MNLVSTEINRPSKENLVYIKINLPSKERLVSTEINLPSKENLVSSETGLVFEEKLVSTETGLLFEENPVSTEADLLLEEKLVSTEIYLPNVVDLEISLTESQGHREQEKQTIQRGPETEKSNNIIDKTERQVIGMIETDQTLSAGNPMLKKEKSTISGHILRS